MKRKLLNTSILSIGISNNLLASTGAEQAKMLVMAVASIIIIIIANLRKKK